MEILNVSGEKVVKAIIYSLLFLLASTASFSIRLETNVQAASSLSFDYPSVVSGVNIEKIKGNIQTFVGFGSRVTGYPGCDEAAQFIYDKFVEYGLENISYETYDVATPYDYGANITVLDTGEIIEAYPVGPNFVETCAIQPEGLDGPLIYAGDGELSSYKDRIEGSIVLMDFDSKDRWVYAAEFGAKAVIFIEKETTNVNAGGKTLGIPLDFPRLYVKREDGNRLLNLIAEHRTLRVNIKSLMVYEKRTGANIVGFIPGNDLELSKEVVIIASHYDSSSIIPSMAPGAEESCGIATLLELARFLGQNPPNRTVMFVAFSGHDQALQGSREFVYQHFNEIGSKLRLLINLDLDTQSNTVGVLYWGYEYMFNKEIRRFDVIRNLLFGKYLPEIEKQLNKEFGVEDLILQDPQSLSPYVDEVGYQLDSEPFSLAGGLGFSFYTTHVRRIYQGTPFDKFDKLSFENLQPVVEFVFCSVFSLINDKDAKLPELQPMGGQKFGEGGFTTVEGRVLEYDINTAWYKPVPNALVLVIVSGVGYRFSIPYAMIYMADGNGSFTVHGLEHFRSGSQDFRSSCTFASFVDSPTYGPIDMAPDFGKYGSVYGSSNIDVDQPVKFVNTVVFRCSSMAILGIMDPKRAGASWIKLNLDVRIFEIDTAPDFFSALVDWSGFNVMVFAESGEKIEVIFRSVEVEPTGWLINATTENPEGYGFKIESGKNLVINRFQIVWDTYLLDDHRIQVCQGNNIQGATATRYHDQAWSHIQNALEALNSSQPDYETFNKEILEAWGLECTASLEIKLLMKDAIQTTVFFFILLIPFAFLAERLLIESKNVIKRIASMAALFIAFTVLLYFIHPGFRLASNIYMIIMGLTLTILISPGIALIILNAATTLKEVRKALLGAHFAEMSRGAAFLSAFSIGIENIKRRKIRSALTFLLIIIIIFSLISFTSITNIAITKPHVAKGQTTYNGFLVTNPMAYPITQGLIDYMETYGNIATISKRAYLYPVGTAMRLVGPNGTVFYVLAAIGLSPEEANVSGIDRSLIDGMWFPEPSQQVCIISDTAAQKLKVGVGDVITYAGIELTVIGIFNSEIYSSITDLDQSIITPLLRTAMGTRTGGAPSSTSPNATIILPYEFALSLGAAPFSLSLRFMNATAILEVAKDVSDIFPGVLIYAGFNGTIFTFLKGEEITFYGWQMFIIPFAMAFLIILNAMLAAVYERVREIGIYSSLGLSPFHVSGLFLAESSIYAVVSAVVGYILGNIGSMVLRVFQILPPEFIPNISSSWVVYAVGMGIASSLLATFYPAYKSARLVTPSLERAWKIPTKPRGDDWEIPLPFTITEEEADGVLAYMKEYFEAHQTERAGDFWILNLNRLEREEGETLMKSLKMTTRLAPYEAGIEQESELMVASKKGETRCHTAIHIKRILGVMHIWQLANRKYIDVVRKQLLLWKSLREEDKTKYLKR